MKKSNQSQFAQIFFRLRRNKAAMLGLVIFLVGVLIAVFAPLIMTHDYAAMDVAARLQGPSAAGICSAVSSTGQGIPWQSAYAQSSWRQ